MPEVLWPPVFMHASEHICVTRPVSACLLMCPSMCLHSKAHEYPAPEALAACGPYARAGLTIPCPCPHPTCDCSVQMLQADVCAVYRLCACPLSPILAVGAHIWPPKCMSMGAGMCAHRSR